MRQSQAVALVIGICAASLLGCNSRPHAPELSDEPVYVICGTGARSGKAAQFYRSQGIDARNVAGGTKGWIEQGRPVVEGPDRE